MTTDVVRTQEYKTRSDYILAGSKIARNHRREKAVTKQLDKKKKSKRKSKPRRK